MTDPQQPGWDNQQPPLSKKDAKAQAAAAKAYSKSQRNFLALLTHPWAAQSA